MIPNNFLYLRVYLITRMVQTRSQTKKQKEEEIELSVENWFRTNNECVYEKKPDNDYPCLCDEEEELDAWCYRCDKHFSADTEEGGDDGTEEEEWICTSCFKKQEEEVEEVEEVKINICSMCNKETGIVWLGELIYCGDCACKKIGASGIDMNGKFMFVL